MNKDTNSTTTETFTEGGKTYTTTTHVKTTNLSDMGSSQKKERRRKENRVINMGTIKQEMYQMPVIQEFRQ